MESMFVVIANWVLLSCLWWLWFVEYKQYRLDRTRQDLFSVRDDLFEYWDRHNLDFDNPAYRLTRDMLNGSIRFAHRLSLIRLAGSFVSHKRFGKRLWVAHEEELARGLQSLPKKHRKKIQEARRDMHFLMIKHVGFNSLVLGTVYLLIKGILYLQRSFDSDRRTLHDLSRQFLPNLGIDAIDAEMVEVGREKYASS